MAGTDLTFRVSEDEELLARTLLRNAQRTARTFGVRLSYRREPGQFYVALNGRAELIEAMREEVTTETLAVARSSSALTPARRRTAVATRMLAALDERVDDLMTSLHELAGLMHREGWAATPNSIVFDPAGKTHLKQTLTVLTRVLAQHIAGRVAVRTVVEEVHTGLEHVMRAYLGRRAAGMSYAEMVDALAADGIASAEQAEAIKALKDARRDAKHRAQGVRASDLSPGISAAVSVIHRTLVALNR